MRHVCTFVSNCEEGCEGAGFWLTVSARCADARGGTFVWGGIPIPVPRLIVIGDLFSTIYTVTRSTVFERCLVLELIVVHSS